MESGVFGGKKDVQGWFGGENPIAEDTQVGSATNYCIDSFVGLTTQQ